MAKPPNKVTQGAVAILLLLNGIAALWGGGALVADPSGSSLGLSSDWLVSGPFVDYAIPGLILFIVLGIGSVVAGAAALLGWHWWPKGLAVIGAGIVVWIGVQMAVLAMFHVFQLIVGLIGAGALFVGLGAWRTAR